MSFCYILFRGKKTPKDALTPQRQSQFTPKMKANAVQRLLSSLVWIDQYNECKGMASFMEFIVFQCLPGLLSSRSWSGFWFNWPCCKATVMLQTNYFVLVLTTEAFFNLYLHLFSWCYFPICPKSEFDLTFIQQFENGWMRGTLGIEFFY